MQLYQETGTLFVTNGLCLDEKENYYFCHLTTPDMNIRSCLMTITSVVPFCASDELLFPDGKMRRIYDAGCGPRFCPGCFLPPPHLYSLQNNPFIKVDHSVDCISSKEENTLAIILLPSMSSEASSFSQKLVHYTLEKCWYDQKDLYPKMKTVIITHNRFPYPSEDVLSQSYLVGQKCVRKLLMKVCDVKELW